MWYSISNLVFLFFIYSFIGWLWETVYCSLKDKQFVYRGFLAGPYCPVYGFAVTTVLFLTKPFQENLPILFFSGLIIATVFEYVAACFLERVFHMKLWDYSQEAGNIKGRIAPRISLFWGFGVVFL
ncbi:membrane protein [Streptococcus troglodytae]|uniref:Membrane protein n=1 Tax=Streptococcus troglodytae TaxID=1111760 RepID=A0A1L7LKZ7_9STRE|nr:membrane protein [Streptococcus troglodytae]